ncbi:leucine-rich repeat-containing protein 70-like isoform X1 [Mytilus edulis]|uniref:leucine-rich repeat-containing protein 70-like isoform X1 n=1 Tax=Mytilus edulis TaxID=6550 RepID=UPI0039EFFC66
MLFKTIAVLTLSILKEGYALPCTIPGLTMCECQGTRLYCTGQNLAQIPSNIPKTTTYLDVSSNRISAINATSLSGLTSLISLTFTENEISSIEDGAFADLHSLERLSLQNNKINSIDANLLSGLTLLEDLSLDNNEISTIEDGAFSDLGSLLTLSLYSNKISSLDAKLFSRLTLLRSLEISENEITSIEDDVFSGLQSVISLSLSNNRISRIEDGAFSDLQSLRLMQLRGNPLICCTMADFFEWRSNQTNIGRISGTCTDFNLTTDINSFNASKCPKVDGGWSSWVNSTCSATCGNGIQSRNRTCNSPLPSAGGKYCEGSNEESLKCSLTDCPEKKRCKRSRKKPE